MYFKGGGGGGPEFSKNVRAISKFSERTNEMIDATEQNLVARARPGCRDLCTPGLSYSSEGKGIQVT